MKHFTIDPKHVEGILHTTCVKTQKPVVVVESEVHRVKSASWSGGTHTMTVTYRCPKAVNGVITLGEESVVVEHGTFCGKTAPVYLFVHPTLYARLEALVPQMEGLTPRQLRVLTVISYYTSAGRKSWRERHGVSKATWDGIVQELTVLGCTKPNGAVTPQGRNLAEKTDPYSEGLPS